MIGQNSDRFPKHLCYKNVISFPLLWFSHEFYVQRGVVAAEKYVEYPEHPWLNTWDRSVLLFEIKTESYRR